MLVMPQLSRRRLLAASVPALGGAAAALHSAVPHSHPWDGEAHAASSPDAHRDGHAGGHANFRDGRTVDHRTNGFDPHAILRDFDWGTTTRLPNGTVAVERDEPARRAVSRSEAGAVPDSLLTSTALATGSRRTLPAASRTRSVRRWEPSGTVRVSTFKLDSSDSGHTVKSSYAHLAVRSRLATTVSPSRTSTLASPA